MVFICSNVSWYNYIQYTQEKTTLLSAVHIFSNPKIEITVKPNGMVVSSLLWVNFNICSSFHQYLEDNVTEVNLS